MLWLILILVALVIGAGLVLVALKSPSGQEQTEKRAFEVRYRRVNLMTNTEQPFFKKLLSALPDHVVAPQVSMSALVDVVEHQARGKYRYANRSKIADRRVDFVLISRQSGKVEWVVELDDATHDSADRQEEDRQRDAILVSAGYRVKRYDARRLPSVDELATQLRA